MDRSIIMSSGPTLTGQTCIEATKRDYINLEFSRQNWCTYEKICNKDDLICTSVDVCLLCKYRKPLDIPLIIELMRKRKHES
jgi:hypothetical protein